MVDMWVILHQLLVAGLVPFLRHTLAGYFVGLLSMAFFLLLIVVS